MVLWVFSLCTFSAQETYRRKCRWNQIALERPGKAAICLNCPECPEGQGLVPQCGSVAGINATVQCVQCKLGETYSDRHDLSSCKPCTICDINEETISPCTKTKNAVCGKCNAGYYRAVTGDCHPCSWCCTDSKDWKEDIEKQCSEQSNLPAKQICRYDVTIKCPPVTNNPTIHVSWAATTKPGGLHAMQDIEEAKTNSGLWLTLVATFAALCVSIVILVIYCRKKQQTLSQLLCGTPGCQYTLPIQEDYYNEPQSSLVVTGGKQPSAGQMV